MKIGYASRWLPSDRVSWSGTIHYCHEEIRKRFETEVFHFEWTWLLREFLTTQKSINRRWFGKQTSVEFLDSYARYFSGRLTRELKRRPVDCLLVPGSSQLIAYVETEIPIIYYTDATFQQLQGYYPGFSNLPEYNVRQGIALDRRAFQKASVSMLASDWARRSVVSDYGIDEGRTVVAPFGANLGEIPARESLDLDAGGSCRLLFLGVDWQRKGGEIVLSAFRMLREMNLRPELHIIGCTPPLDLSGEPGITVIPFLDKNRPDELARLKQILRQTDLLFLPTRAECAGIVFSEASAFGVPSITTDTGGVRSYVREGINGYALPPEAGAETYAELIATLISDGSRFRLLRQQSRDLFDEALSWERWGEGFERVVAGLL
jgi:glycosyltransferase involved in cell wall biosynthesis